MSITEKSTPPGSKPIDSRLDPAKASTALADGLRYLGSEWGWSGSQIARVLRISPRTINEWLKRATVPFSGKEIAPEIEAVIHLLAIQRSLAAMFSESFHQLHWLETVHPDFGVSPMGKMSESLAGLIHVRQYLDYVRGRGA